MQVGDKKVLLDFLLGRGIEPPTAAQAAAQLVVADGFRLEVYSTDVPLARWPLATATGDLIVARTRADEIVLLERDADGDGKPDAVRTLLADLDHPHGLALHDGWLYVGDPKGIGRIRFDEAPARCRARYERVVDDFTADGFHPTKTIGFGPDGMLYVAQGSSCNVCIEKDARRATIMRMQPDGNAARDLRHRPAQQRRLRLGALGRRAVRDRERSRPARRRLPPDELNRIERRILRLAVRPWRRHRRSGPRRGHEAEIARAFPPVHDFRAHNAPLGIAFLRGAQLPPAYARTALVALHGSWNRSTPDGYKVVALDWQADGSIVERDFLTGFLGTDGMLGRPAGVTQGPDGAIFITDDYAGVIYRCRAGNRTLNGFASACSMKACQTGFGSQIVRIGSVRLRAIRRDAVGGTGRRTPTRDNSARSAPRAGAREGVEHAEELLQVPARAFPTAPGSARTGCPAP